MSQSNQIREKSQFGERVWTPIEKEKIKELLESKLEKDMISYRSGPGGQKVAYLESWRAIELANGIFGFDGWSSSVINLSQDFLDEVNGRISCGISAVVRVSLKDGTYHELIKDVGYGISEGQRSKGAALEKARKEAVSDALKRALRLFGNALGNSIYDKQHVKNVKNQPPKPVVPPNTNTNANLPSTHPPSQGNQPPMQQQKQWFPNPPPNNMYQQQNGVVHRPQQFSG